MTTTKVEEGSRTSIGHIGMEKNHVVLYNDEEWVILSYYNENWLLIGRPFEESTWVNVEAVRYEGQQNRISIPKEDYYYG